MHQRVSSPACLLTNACANQAASAFSRNTLRSSALLRAVLHSSAF